MPTVAPRFPPVIDVSNGSVTQRHGMRAGEPVKGFGQWAAFGDAANWVIAQGGTLATMGPSYYITPGNNRSYRFYAWPRSQIVARLWCFSLGLRNAAVADHLAFGSVEIPTGTARGAWFIDNSSAAEIASTATFATASTFHFVEPLSSPSGTAGEINMTIYVDAASLSDVFVDGVSCYEIPRATITTFGPNPSPLGAYAAGGVLPSSVQTGAPIIEGNFASDAARSVDGVHRLAMWEELVQSAGRRSCLFSDWRPLGQTVGTTYTNLFMRDPAVLARTGYADSGGVREIAVAVYGSGPAGSNVRFTGFNDAVTVNLPTSDGWATGVLDVDGENPQNWGTDGGLQSGARDRIAIEAQRVGAGTCTVYGVCMGEVQL